MQNRKGNNGFISNFFGFAVTVLALQRRRVTREPVRWTPQLLSRLTPWPPLQFWPSYSRLRQHNTRYRHPPSLPAEGRVHCLYCIHLLEEYIYGCMCCQIARWSWFSVTKNRSYLNVGLIEKSIISMLVLTGPVILFSYDIS